MLNLKIALGASAALVLAQAPALAQWEPSRSVEFNVAAGAGGGSDIFARAFSDWVESERTS